MSRHSRPGAVIFTGNKERLSAFYAAMTGLPMRVNEGSVTVLASDHFELVIHALSGEPPGRDSTARQDSYVKPFFPVASLADAREKAAQLGGELRPAVEEWEARGFRACEALDPDGNLIQFRQDMP